MFKLHDIGRVGFPMVNIRDLKSIDLCSDCGNFIFRRSTCENRQHCRCQDHQDQHKYGFFHFKDPFCKIKKLFSIIARFMYLPVQGA